MKQLQSSLENKEYTLADARKRVEAAGFVLGGNWEYDRGFFDQALDQKDEVWLRLPFTVLEGELDSEQKDSKAVIKFGTPFVLRHLYNDGLEQDAEFSTVGGFINQFQEPIDPDASLDDRWVERAEQVLRDIEAAL